MKRIVLTSVVMALLALSATAASAEPGTIPQPQDLEKLRAAIFQPDPVQPQVDDLEDLSPGWEAVDHCERLASACNRGLCECVESCNPCGVASTEPCGVNCVCAC